MNKEIKLAQVLAKQYALSHHPLFTALTTKQAVQTFMETHIFAVWDFMSLLKALQRKLTCVELPWRPSPYPPHLVRIINEIVLGEESDLDQEGRPTSHFALYLTAMQEVGANINPIQEVLQLRDWRNLSLPFAEITSFVSFTLQVATSCAIEEVAAVFLYGRENLVPSMFENILATLSKSDKIQCPSLVYYFQRHIELDGNEHGPQFTRCLEFLCGDDELKWERALDKAQQSLQKREELWDGIYNRIIVHNFSAS